MASPQCEDGYTKIANELLDAIIKTRFPGQELRIMLAVLRKTYGYGKKADQISYGQLAQLTDIPRPRVIEHVKSLVSKKGLGSLNNGTSTPVTLWINKDFETWLPSPKKETSPNHETSASPNHETKSSLNHGTHKRKKENIKENINTTLPEWLPKDLWDSFLAHRKAIKAPIPPQNAQRVIKKLSKLKDDGYPPEYVIETMIERGWRWYKPEWDKGSKYGNQGIDTRHDNLFLRPIRKEAGPTAS